MPVTNFAPSEKIEENRAKMGENQRKFGENRKVDSRNLWKMRVYHKKVEKYVNNLSMFCF